MKWPWLKWLRLDVLCLLFFVLYPLLGLEKLVLGWTGQPLGSDLATLFIYGILALGLNVVVGYTGLLHLGIAAFFGIGAYITGILMFPSYPFQVGFFVALLCATVGAGLLGTLLGAPTLRLRGDYLALVTLGFGEVARFTLRNMGEITGGMRGLNPVPPPPQWLADLVGLLGLGTNWRLDYEPFYYLMLIMLVLVYLLLGRLEASRLGRAWVAIREDELAATCMGLSATRVKLSAFALGAALAGLAGCLYAVKLSSTADPEAYNFSRSVIILCCVILGGLGSLRGAVLGIFLLMGFDNILTPILDTWVQHSGLVASVTADIEDPQRKEFVTSLLTFKSWNLVLFGLALILMMRFRPEGLLPSRRVQLELHPTDVPAPVVRG